MEWKNKLYNHEVPAPENIWDRVTHDLDNGDFVVFKQQLFHAEVTPPANVWSRVVQDLDNHDFVVFKDRLYNEELAPPTNIWSKISHDLENGDYLAFKDLSYTEVTPPADTWKNIEELLSETKVIPFRKKNNLLLKVLAAAGVVGMMFFVINGLIVKDDIETVVSDKTKTNQEKTIKADPAEKQPEVKLPEETVRQYTIASSQSTRKVTVPAEGVSFESDYKSFNHTVSSVSRDEKSYTDKLDVNSGMNRKIRNTSGEIREDINLLDLPNSYFMMTGPNGQSMRISSKFRNTIQYLNAENKEELLDVILRESQYWKSLFKDWKDKVGNSAFVPSMDNFMDIAELMKLIQEPVQK